MEDTPQRGYFQQYLARMAPAPLPPPPLPLPKMTSKPSILSVQRRGGELKRQTAANRPQKTGKTGKQRKTLVDAFKQHGMKLCDGSKLNAVAYLSQNDLHGLEGIEQFRSVRVLSLAANLLTRFKDIEKLSSLKQLRHLNLAGNPLCEHPYYRLRVVVTLPHVHVLDTMEISKLEREVAAVVVSHDKALRELVLRNHIEIQKLQRLSPWIVVLNELKSVVLRDAVTGRYDQLPCIDADFNIEKFLSLWRLEDSISALEAETLETQMMGVISKTKAKLACETPQTKAKELLFRLANVSSFKSSKCRTLDSLPTEMRRECVAWDDAYAHVLQLQQQTIASLRGECERKYRETVRSLRELVVLNPYRRRHVAIKPGSTMARERDIVAPSLWPCQQVPVEQPVTYQAHQETYSSVNTSEDMTPMFESLALTTEAAEDTRNHETKRIIPRQNPRSGDFGNKTLHEAVQSFQLRQPSRVKPTQKRTQRISSTAQNTAASNVSRSNSRAVTDTTSAVLQMDLQTSPIQAKFEPQSSCGRFERETGSVTETSNSGGSICSPFSEFGCDSHSEMTFATTIAIASHGKSGGAPDEVKQFESSRPHVLHTVHEENRNCDTWKSRDLMSASVPQRNQENDADTAMKYLPREDGRFVMGDRQRELEAREEQYLSALMESEQRELNLRQEVVIMNTQMARMQQALMQKDDERSKIKSEIGIRVAAVARPMILRRFFVKWIRFYYWALQLRQLRRKRTFVMQHDSFWCWRRKVWVQQQLRRVRRRQNIHLLRSCITEWANYTRITIIAMHTQALRQTQLLKKIVFEWRQEANTRTLSKSMHADKKRERSAALLARSFEGWRIYARRMKQSERLLTLVSRGSQKNLLRVVLSDWKLFIFEIARPQREKVCSFIRQRTRKAKLANLRHLQLITRALRLARNHMVRKCWSAWRRWTNAQKQNRFLSREKRLVGLQEHFQEWKVIVHDRVSSLRALSLAARHVNHRRLRKLWMHWKIFSITRKRHMQGVSKALKHYFIKLLRRTWKYWRGEARANLVSRRAHRHGELRYYFSAFCQGINQLQQAKRRLLFVGHAIKRRQLGTTRKIFSVWSVHCLRRRKCRMIQSTVQQQRSRTLLSFVWSRWKTQQLVRLQHQFHIAKENCKTLSQQRHMVENDLSQKEERATKLNQEVRELAAQVDSQARDIKLYQSDLLHQEETIVTLEKEVDELKRRLQQAEHNHIQGEMRLEREVKTNQEGMMVIAEENVQLKSRAKELEKRLDDSCRQRQDLEHDNQRLQKHVADLIAQAEEIQRTHAARERDLQALLADRSRQLEDEERARGDTVRRLQEYEKQIASTCAEIGDHEKAHEDECIKLRAEITRVESLWKEESVRNAELERLLSEKNDQIMVLTAKLKNLKLSSPKEVTKSQTKDDNTSPRITEALTKPLPTASGTISREDFDAAAGIVAENNGLSTSLTDAVRIPRIHVIVHDNPVAVTQVEPTDEERKVDERTSRIHADIQLLQDRITKRLQQTPCAPPSIQLAGTGRRAAEMGPNYSDSVTSVSESDTDQRQASQRRPRPSGLREASARSSRTVNGQHSENESRMANRPTNGGAKQLGSRSTGPRRPVKRSSRIDSAPLKKTHQSRNSAKTGRKQLKHQPHESMGPRLPPPSSAPTVPTLDSNTPELDDVPLGATATGSMHHSPEPSPQRPSIDIQGGTDSSRSTSPSKDSASVTKFAQGIDVSSTSLAAISARLMPYIVPAELEIARINRDIVAGLMKSDRIGRKDDEEDVTNPGGINGSALQQGQASSASSIPTKTGGEVSALHDSMIAEEWVNVHLETSGVYLLPGSDIKALLQSPDVRGGMGGDDSVEDDEAAFAFRRKSESGPLGRAGIDRWTLYRLGMPKDLVDRLYRAIYVYTSGFHNIINEIASHCPPSVERHISSNVWLTFLLLLEQCGNGKYEMAMLKFKQATQEWRKQMQEEFMNEKLRMEADIQVIETQLHEEMARNTDKSELIGELASDVSLANTTIAEQRRVIADTNEQLRLLRLEILVHEDVEKKLNAQIDDARKDYEVANSERFNALTERYALEEEIRKLHSEMERLEAEKTNYAKRMHETLFMNQALRATNETLKQNAVVLNMDKDKLDKEKQDMQEQVDNLHEELQDIKLLKASVEHDLVESTRRQAHLEERLRAMKEQLDAELEQTARHVKEIANLTTQIDEEKVKAGVLEAKCNLLTAEKQNTGMRAQDKLRIERLLNQKLELENQIESLKLERTKDQEQIWNLRASLEALDSELQHTKRVFSAGQQAFLHSERSAEQLRHQLQEVEKNYEKASKNLTSLRERFKMFEESSKEQVTKLEVELKVTSAQLREVTYVNRDNAATIADLTKTLEVAEKEAKILKGKLDESEKQYEQLMNEKEDLKWDQKQRDQQSNSSRQIITSFIRDLQNLLALVKMDEYPVDEALRELLRMVKETFGQELDISRVLDDEDEPLDFEEEYDDEELAEEERERRTRLMARRAGFSMGEARTSSMEGVTGEGTTGLSAGLECEGRRRLTKVSRMSKFRRSKLDAQVKKLQRELEMKSDFARSLEGVVCTQADEIATLTATKEQQERWLKLNGIQKGMMAAEIEGLHLSLVEARGAHKKSLADLQEAKIDLVMETNKRFQMEMHVQGLRRQYDMQCASMEDLMSKIWRQYEYELYMRSLRRDEAVQATVTIAEQFTQTLVPRRNPVLERVRVPAMNLPAMNPTSARAQSIIQQINDTAKALLPNVELQLHEHPSTAKLSRASLPPYVAGPQHIQTPSIRPIVRSPQTYGGPRGGRGRRHLHRQLMMAEKNTPKELPQAPPMQSVPPHLVRHVNEFGMRQDVLISPVYPPYFPAQASAPPTRSRMPRKPRTHQQQLCFNEDDRNDTGGGWDARVQQQQELPSVPGITGGVRYHRGLLRTGMEILRGHGGGQGEDEDLEEEGDFDEAGEYDDEGEEDREPPAWSRSRTSLHSPSKLELAVRDYHDEQEASGRGLPSPSRYYAHRLKDDEVRGTEENPLSHEDDDDDDTALADDMRNSRFVPGVLYPILPPR